MEGEKSGMGRGLAFVKRKRPRSANSHEYKQVRKESVVRSARFPIKLSELFIRSAARHLFHDVPVTRDV